MKVLPGRLAAAVVATVGLLASSPGPAAAATCDQFTCVTMHDTIPNFAGQPSIRSVRTGAWSAASTWNLGRIPKATDIVGITGGTTVTVDGTAGVAAVVGIEAAGKLAFRTDIATRLTVGTLLVLPQGALEVGTAAAPVSAAVTAEIVIADRAPDTVNDGVGVFDPSQFGTGLISVDGRVTISGAAKTTFTRLATEPQPGQTSLKLAAAVSGWRAGDRIFLPDSKHVPSATASSYAFEGEELAVSSVSSDGLTVYLQSPVKYAHPGARDGNDVLEFLPHVGNLGRNVLVRSANPLGSRGHILLTDRSDVDIRYVAIRNMGRATIDPIDSTTFDSAGNVTHLGTNQIGRYPLHIHHLLGPVATPANGRQFTILGNAIDDDAVINRRKWALTVHASHYGLISNNVVYNAGGWGIGTEDGSESFNEFSSNFVAKVRGEGTREYGEAGNGMWFRGPNNYVRDNVVANVRGNSIEGSHGIQYYQVYTGSICVPNFKGADMSQCTRYNANALPLLEFARNEVYGAMEIGLTVWWVGSDAYVPLGSASSTIKDFRTWHFTLYGYYGYPASRLVFDGYVARGRKSVLGNAQEFLRGIWFSDYMNHDVTIRRADIQNMRDGIMAPYFSKGTTLIEDSYLRNSNNIVVSTIGAPGAYPYGPAMPPKQTTIRNVQFAQVNGSVGGVPQYDIYMNYWLQFGSANLVKRDAVYVYGYNKVAGSDFQVFYNQQAASFVVPQSSGNLAGSPVAGLTNAQNWSTYKIAIAGEVATNTTTHPKMYGLVRMGTPVPPPTAPTITTQPANATVAAGQTATFAVAATGTAPMKYQWQKNFVDIPGATSASYTTPAVWPADANSTFRCIVENGGGMSYSVAASLWLTTSGGGGSTSSGGGTSGGGGSTGATNKAPVVNAGADQTVSPKVGATLKGTVTDDGLPDKYLKITWSKVSGPGTVTFGTPSAASSTAKFSRGGIYTLKLTATDSALTTSDTVVITVK